MELTDKKISKKNLNHIYIFILSTKNKQQLFEQVKRILKVLNEDNYGNKDMNIKDICYTLQTGRELMEARLAFTVCDLNETKFKLEAFLEGFTEEEGIYSGEGKIRTRKEINEKFGSEENFKRLIKEYRDAQEFEEICKIVVEGIEIDWDDLFYGLETPNIISIPSYPFDHNIYWLPEKLKENENKVSENEDKISEYENKISEYEKIKTLDDIYFYEEKWIENIDSAKEKSGKSGTVICFLNNKNMQEKLKQESLRNNMQIKFLFIEESNDFNNYDYEHYSIYNQNEESYIKCFETIAKEIEGAKFIFYFWAMEHPENMQFYSYDVVMLLLKGLVKANIKLSEIMIAGGFRNNLERCYMESLTSLEKSLRMILKEISVKVILRKYDEKEQREFLVDFLSEYEVNSNLSIFYDEGIRKKLMIKTIKIQNYIKRIKNGGIYLITGGLGGLGKIFAEYLLDKYDAKVILTGRKSYEEQSENLAKFKKYGDNIKYFQSDIGNLNDLQNVVTTIIREYGELNGVIHAAGVEGSGNIIINDIKQFHSVIDPKTIGVINLWKALKNVNLDFICLFSSISAVLGDFGSCDYSIGNKFLMMAAKYLFTNAKAICWPLWKDGGMGVSDRESCKLYLKSSGQRYLKKNEGIMLFEKLVNSEENEVLAFCGDEKRIKDFLNPKSITKKETIIKRKTVSGKVGKRRNKNMIGFSVNECIIWELKDITERILGIPKNQIQDDDNLADLGYDSITLAEFSNLLTERFETDISPDIFFNYPTFDRLSEYFATRYKELMEKLYREGKMEDDKIEYETVEIKSDNEELNIDKYVDLKRSSIGYEEVSIVGISGKFPGASNTDELWNIIEEGKDVIREVPKERKEWYCNSGDNVNYSMGVLEKIEEFDPRFFEISPAEAECMDPQQRILLEEIWKALEDAGYGKRLLNNEKIGVFVGAEDSDYKNLLQGDVNITAVNTSMLSARIAYFLNLKGPNMTINTACSSGLVALNQAYQSIRNGDCDAAIVAGVSIMSTSSAYKGMESSGMISKDRTCYAFDKRANGMVPAEAVAVVILKKSSKAEKDRNRIYGKIKGCGINYDGRTNGITAPNGESQRELIESVYDKYNIEPEKIGFILAHGTGTKLGDPIEINSLADAFSKYTNKKQYCALGSVKSNIGHSLAASGIVSLIVLLKAMQMKKIPIQIHCEEESDYIKWQNSPFFINHKTKEWNDEGKEKRYGGVSAFGMGGTNAHIVIESYENKDKLKDEPPYNLLVLSAKSKEALEKKCIDLADWLESTDNTDSLTDIAYTLLEGRMHFLHRIAIFAKNKEEAAYILRNIKIGQEQSKVYYKRVERSFKQLEAIKDMVDELANKCFKEENVEELKNKLEALAELYSQGYDVNGDILYTNSRRVKLPFYPFINKKYWCMENNKKNIIKMKASENELSNNKINELSNNKINELSNNKINELSNNKINELSSDDVLYVREIWKKSEISNKNNIINGTIVIFLSEEQDKNYLEKNIYEQNCKSNIVFVSKGSTYEKVSNNLYIINSENEEDYVKLFLDIKNYHEIIKGLIYLWPVEECCTIEDSYILVMILKSMYKSRILIEKILIAGLVNTSNEWNNLDSLIGIKRSTRMILPKTEFKFVAGYKDEISKEEFIKIIIEEYRISDNQPVLYENGERKILSLEKWIPNKRDINLLKECGVYVITGGLGGIGKILTKWLLKEYKANVIVTGRNLDEEKKQWLKEVNECEGNVLFIKADVCNKEQMLNVIEKAKYTFGKIDGIFHVAGLSGEGSVLEQPLTHFKKVIAPKVKGTLLLDEIVKNDNIDFICYFSSTSAILGDFGSCEYAVGNRFMMSYVQSSSKKSSFKKIVINWPLWKDGGMGLDSDRSNEMYMKASGQKLLTSNEALKILSNVIGQDISQVMVLTGEKDRLERIINIKEESAIHENKDTDEENIKKEVNLDKLKSMLLEKLREIAGKLLKIQTNEMDYDAILAEFGFDSITLGIYANKLSEVFSIEITPDLFYSYPTLLELTDYMMEKFQNEVKTVLLDEVKLIKKENIKKDEINIKYEPEITKEKRNDKIIKKNNLFENNINEDIAVIGISGHFPGANNVEELWNILYQGKNVIKEADEDRIEWHKDNKVRKFGAMHQVSEFDPMFFEIPPSEAIDMDPRQRILLEESWNVLEKAGYGDKNLSEETIGVFVGAEEGDYNNLISKEANITANHNSMISARIAYLLNMNGPNMTINTACSSGLSAVHEACLSIRNGECDAAIVAGVNIFTQPNGYDKMEETGMISHTHTCYAFDKRANGMVPAEAVAVVLLKKMSKAVKDRNPILAKIIGSGINYDGKTNGITAPNGKAQVKLITSIYDKFNINPEKIQYIFAHGTGTRLGDPIEINALKESFEKYTDKKQFCTIGSVKSNLGHSLAASGIVSMISMILAMQKKIIPAQILCEQESDYINWKDSPFNINHEVKNWEAGEENKRIGAVSAFGMSGTNVHVVLENSDEKVIKEEKKIYYPFVLSAKTKSALKQKCIDLSNYIKDKSNKSSLSDICYTLIEGRKNFIYRVAVVVENKEEAIAILKEISQEDSKLHKVKKNFIMSSEEIHKIKELCNEYSLSEDKQSCQKIVDRLCEYYVEGYYLDGYKMFPKDTVRLVEIPGYPFKKDKYWAKKSAIINKEMNYSPIDSTLGNNKLNCIEHKYSIKLDGNEPFLVEHVIQGAKTLPGVAYLEIISSIGYKLFGYGKIIKIANIVWSKPLIVENFEKEIEVDLKNVTDSNISFKIFTNEESNKSVYCQGSLECINENNVLLEDISSIMKNMKKKVKVEDCYELFSNMNMKYGKEFRCMNEMYICDDIILTKISMPKDSKIQLDKYVLQLGIMDAAFQSAIGYRFAHEIENGQVETSIPFALDQISIYDKCQPEMWAVVRKAISKDGIKKYDINLCDSLGKVIIQMKGYTSRVKKENANKEKSIMLFEKKWKPLAISDEKVENLNVQTLCIGIENYPNDVYVMDMTNTEDLLELAERYEEVSKTLFQEIKQWIKDGLRDNIVLQVIVPNSGIENIYSGLVAMLKTASKENPFILSKLIEVDKDESSENISQIIEAEKTDFSEIHVKYENGIRYVPEIREMKIPSINEVPWKDNGVYLITGGVGKIGRKFAEDAAKSSKNTVLILAGRSNNSEYIDNIIKKIRVLGAEAEYVSMDVADIENVNKVISNIKQKYGHLDGIIHTAGIIRDNYILRKSVDDFSNVIRSKVTGTVVLDYATKDMQLDFMIYFSSTAAVFGNEGQIDYSTANAFMDCFAHYRNQLVKEGRRYGITQSINWPLWKNGGMHINTQLEKKLEEKEGLLAMPTDAGISAFYSGLTLKSENFICLYGFKKS